MTTSTADRIRFVSPAAPVSMGDEWYGIATLEHFWIRRRFEVVRRVAEGYFQRAANVVEIGCGHGVVQRQVEDAFGKEVVGFDLNEFALRQTLSRTSPVVCYDIFDSAEEFRGRFDLLLLFDVLEHISNEDAFLDAIRFHAKPGATMLVHVPAFQSLWSRYDEAVGHQRRYSAGDLQKVAARVGMTVETWCYWGLPLIPLLELRKLWMLALPSEKIISAGLDSRNKLLDRALLALSRCEPVPQKLAGTSLFAVIRMPT
jgi:hypothetical protein